MKSTANLLEIDKFKIQNGDVIITKDSETPYDIGIPAVVTDDITDLVCGYHLALIKPNNEVVDSIYLSKQLASVSSVNYFSRMAAGSTRYGLSNTSIRRVPILVAPKKQQERISRILFALDQTIEKTEALIQKYQQIKQGLMHDLFTRGVTPDGKLRPTREQIPELYKETSIGWIPREWKVNRIRNLCHPVTKGATPSKFVDHYDSENSVPFVRVENLTFDGSFKTEKSLLFVDKKVHDRELMRSKIFPGDILMNIVGPPLGKVSFVPEAFKELNTNQAVAIFRTFSKKYRNFLLYYLLSDFSQRWFYVRSKQTSGQVNLTLEMCSDLEIPFPQNDREVERISTAIYIVYQKLESEVSIYKKLQKQKSGLMHDLMTGKVRVTVDE